MGNKNIQAKPKSGGGAIGKVFAGMDVIDGIKQTRQEFKNTNNIYDDKLGVNMKGLKPEKLASEELDELLKIAGVGSVAHRLGMATRAGLGSAKSGIRNGAKRVADTAGDILQEADAFTADNARGVIEGLKARNMREALVGGAKAAPGIIGNAGLALGAGAGTTRLLDKLDKDETGKNSVKHKAIGSMVGAGLGAVALSGGGMYQGSKIIGSAIKDNMKKHPIQEYAKNNAVFGEVLENAKKVSKEVSKNKQVKNLGADAVKNQSRAAASNALSKRKTQQSAMNVIRNSNNSLGRVDDALKSGALTDSLRDQAARAKSDFVNSFMLNNSGAGVEDAVSAWKSSADKASFDKATRAAVPVIKRQHKLASEELDDLIKLAGVDPAEAKSIAPQVLKGLKNTGKYVGDKIISPALTAMSSTAAPVIATTLLSQRMMNKAKEDSEESQKAQQSQQPQVVINLDKSLIDSYPSKTAAEDSSHDIGDVLTDKTKDINEIKGAEKLHTDMVHVGNGIKKQFRMHDIHGQYGMNP